MITTMSVPNRECGLVMFLLFFVMLISVFQYICAVLLYLGFQ